MGTDKGLDSRCGFLKQSLKNCPTESKCHHRNSADVPFCSFLSKSEFEIATISDQLKTSTVEMTSNFIRKEMQCSSCIRNIDSL